MGELHFNSKHTDEELLNILRDYAINVKFPTSREFTAKNGLPCSRVYIDRFGSFQKAILKANIKIPSDRLRYFNREELPDQVLLDLLKSETTKMIKSENRLLTAKEITANKNLPTEAVYHRRFGGMENAYRLIGYDMYNFGRDELKQEMANKYIELATLLDRTPTSRDIDDYSKKGFCKAASTYDQYFGGIIELQVFCGFVPIKVGKLKSDEDLIKDLIWLNEELGRTPTQNDFINYPLLASASTYILKFGTFVKALKMAGLDSSKYKVKYTKSGTPCYSRMEHLFAQMLEKYNIEYEKDSRYSNYISDYEYKSTFDFVITFNNKKYFIEIFGMEGVKKYDETKLKKINVCKENNVPLIWLSFKDFWNKRQKDIYENLINEIKKFEQ